MRRLTRLFIVVAVLGLLGGGYVIAANTVGKRTERAIIDQASAMRLGRIGFSVEDYDRGIFSSTFNLIAVLPADLANPFIDEAFRRNASQRWVVPVSLSHGPITGGGVRAARLEATVAIPAVSADQMRVGMGQAWQLVTNLDLSLAGAIQITADAAPVDWQLEGGRGVISIGALDADLDLDLKDGRIAGTASFDGITGQGPGGVISLNGVTTRVDGRLMSLGLLVGDLSAKLEGFQFRNESTTVDMGSLSVGQQTIDGESSGDTLTLQTTLEGGQVQYRDATRGFAGTPGNLTITTDRFTPAALKALYALIAEPGLEGRIYDLLSAMAVTGAGIDIPEWQVTTDKGTMRLTVNGRAPRLGQSPALASVMGQVSGTSLLSIDRSLALWLAEEATLAQTGGKREDLPPATLRTLAQARIKVFVDTGRVVDTGAELIVEQELKDGVLYWSGAPFLDMVSIATRPDGNGLGIVNPRQ